MTFLKTAQRIDRPFWTGMREQCFHLVKENIFHNPGHETTQYNAKRTQYNAQTTQYNAKRTQYNTQTTQYNAKHT